MQYKESGYDQKVNETVSVVGARATELGQKTWGIMRGVMAMASQTVEQYTKEPGRSSYDNSYTETLSPGHDDDPYQHVNSGENQWHNTRDNEKLQSSKGRDSWDDWDDEGKQGNSKGYNGGNSSSYGNHNNISPQQGRSQSSATMKATESRKPATGGDSWTGWDDHDQNDDVDTFFTVDHKADKKKSDGWNDWNDSDVKWTEGGFK